MIHTHRNYDSDRITGVLRDFHNATGINIQFFDTDLHVYSYEISHNTYCSAIKTAQRGVCIQSDAALIERCRATREPAMHRCHAGLIDIAVPVVYEKTVLGYLILGQMRGEEDLPAGYLETLGLDCRSMREHYLSLPLYDNERIQSVLNLATIVAKYTILERMLTPGFNGVMQRALDYIDKNLHLPISVDDIAREALVSKSTLYKQFREVCGGSVGDYLMKKRLERARQLLVETDLSIQEIAQAAGFSSAAYFTANFKKENGMAPLRFRKHKA